MRTRILVRAVAAISTILTLLLAGPGPGSITAGSAARAADAPTAKVRLLPAVVGAAAVDVYVDGQRVFGGAAFGDFSTYEDVASGNHLVQVFATGARTSGTGLLRARIVVRARMMYTLALGGVVTRLLPVLVRDNVTPPAKGMARVRVVHLSADTPAIDVAVKGGAVLFGNVRYGSVTPDLETAPQTVDLQVRPAGWPIAARTVPMATIAAGKVYTFYAVGTLLGTSSRLRIVSDVLPTLARVRVVHAAPGVASVDVYVDGDRIFTGAAFGDVSTYENVAPGKRHVQVFRAGTFPNLVVPRGKGMIDVMESLVAGTDYTVVASRTAGKVTPLVLTDDNTAPTTGMAKVRVVHLAPDGPAVDVRAQTGRKLLPLGLGVTYGTATAPIEVAAGSYTSIVAMPAGKTTVVARAGDVTIVADSVYSVFVVGTVKGMPRLRVVVSQDQ